MGPDEEHAERDERGEDEEEPHGERRNVAGNRRRGGARRRHPEAAEADPTSPPRRFNPCPIVTLLPGRHHEGGRARVKAPTHTPARSQPP